MSVKLEAAKPEEEKSMKTCFSNKGSDYDVIHALAHEVAHMRYPKAAHRSQRFKDATEDYYQQFMSELNKGAAP